MCAETEADAAKLYSYEGTYEVLAFLLKMQTYKAA